MKSYDLPTIEQINAYKTGDISLSDKAFIEEKIKTNPFVKEVVESFSLDNLQAIKSISKRVNSRVHERVIHTKGFWSSYGVWIGFSSIVLLMGLGWFFTNEANEQKVQIATIEKTVAENVKRVQNNDVNFQKNTIGEQEINDEQEEVAQTVNSDLEMESKRSQPETHLKNLVELEEMNKGPMSDAQNLEKNDFKEKLTAIPVIEEQEDLKQETVKSIPDNKIEKSSNQVVNSEQAVNSGLNKSSKVTLSVKSVTLISKLNPRDQVTRKNSNSGGNILGRNEVKQQKGVSYSLNDLPSYPGGDQALFNYFRGKLHPITMNVDQLNFDRSVMLILEINQRGKLVHHEIYGHLHPDHQKALEDAVNNLPKFNAGNGEKVTYSIGISF